MQVYSRDNDLFERERQRFEHNLQQLAPPHGGLSVHPVSPHGVRSPACFTSDRLAYHGTSSTYKYATPTLPAVPEPTYPVASRTTTETFGYELADFAAELSRLVPADASAAATMATARRAVIDAQERAEARTEAAIGEASAARFEADEAADENEKLRQLVADGVAERERLRAERQAVLPQQQPPSPPRAQTAEEQEQAPSLSPWARFNSLQSKVDKLTSELERVTHERTVLKRQLQQQAGQVEQAQAQVFQQAQAAAASSPPQLLLFERDSLRGQLVQQAEQHAAVQATQEAEGRRLWQAMHEQGGAEQRAEAEGATARLQLQRQLEQASVAATTAMGAADTLRAQLDDEARRRQHAERVAHESTRRCAELEMRLAEAARLERSWRAQMEVQATRHAQEVNGIRGRVGIGYR